MRIIRSAPALCLASCLALFVAGCGAGSSPPPAPAASSVAETGSPTLVQFTITSSPSLNPTVEGAAEPVVVRLFRLRDPAGFQRAAFDDLAEPTDEKTLGPDLVGTVEFTIYPGQSETLTRKLEPGDRWLGIVAAYRDHGSAKWRDLIEVKPNQTIDVDLQLGPRGVLARARPSRSTDGSPG